MALALALALWVWKKNVLHLLLGSQLNMSRAVWDRLALAWIGYFVFMSAINGYVALYYSTEDWVNFKIWGYVFPVVFILGQGLYIARHIQSDDQPQGPA
jgi:intracellular septation protein